MAKHELTMSVFISSTGEMATEREICLEIIDEINNIRGAREGFILKPLNWQSSVTSDFGAPPQEIINEQIGDDYDVFIGFVCSRFGTPTKNYESGTQEEFERALQRRLKDPESVKLSFFFKDPKSSDLDLNARELLRIEDFRDGISDQGLFKNFQDSSEFRSQVTASLSRHVDKILDELVLPAAPNSKISSSQAQGKPSSALVTVDEYDPDLGIMELLDVTDELQAAITSRWSEMGAATERLGNRISTRVTELSSVPRLPDGSQDRRKVKIVLDKIAAEMDRHSSILEREIQAAKKESTDFFRLTQRIVLISAEDGMATSEEVSALRETYQTLQMTVVMTSGQFVELKEAISNVPRLTSRINQARRRSEKSMRGLIKTLESFNSGISAVLASLDSEVTRRLGCPPITSP